MAKVFRVIDVQRMLSKVAPKVFHARSVQRKLLKGGKNNMVKTKASVEVKAKSPKRHVKKALDSHLIVGGRSFDSPESVAAFYRSEGHKVKQAMKQFKIDEAEGKLGIAKNSFLKVQSQKRKIDAIEKDLSAHKNALDEKMVYLNSAKDKQEDHKTRVQDFMRKMRLLESEAEKLMKTRSGLMDSESKLITEMKDLAKTAQGDLDIKDLRSVKRLLDFEDSKEAALMKARDLLSEEMRILFLDNTVIEGLNSKSHKDLVKLNNQLASVQGSKKDALQRMHILSMSENEVKERLKVANERIKHLEKQYEEILKK